MRDVLTLSLPMPPSLNRMYRMVGNRFLISKIGKDYKIQLDAILLALPVSPRVFVAERLAVHIAVYPPDKRRRDLDNLAKCLLDCLGGGLIYKDDSQIDDLRISRGEIKNPGLVRVEIGVLR